MPNRQTEKFIPALVNNLLQINSLTRMVRSTAFYQVCFCIIFRLKLNDARSGKCSACYIRADVWTLTSLGDLARDTTVSIEDLQNPSPVLHAAAALLALLVNTTLSVYKPRGMTRYGRRKQREERAVSEGSNQRTVV